MMAPAPHIDASHRTIADREPESESVAAPSRHATAIPSTPTMTHRRAACHMATNDLEAMHSDPSAIASTHPMYNRPQPVESAIAVR